MGVEGTLVGAGLASAVSTVGSSIYLRSIHHTKRGVHVVKSKVVTRTRPRGPLDPSSAETIQFSVNDVAATAPEPTSQRRLPWRAMIAGTVLVFFVCMIVVTGIEWARGEPLSGDGEGTTIGRVSNIQPDEPEPAPETPLPSPSWPTESSVPPESSAPSSTSSEPAGEESSVPETSEETVAPETTESDLFPPPLITEEPTEPETPAPSS